jgi:hypothetical protein
MKSKIILLTLFLLGLQLLSATNYTVTSNADAGAGTLRQAITDANASGTLPITITFSGVSSISLASALPTLNKAMTIDGGSGVTIVGSSATTNMILNGAVAVAFKYITFSGAVLSIISSGTFDNCTFTGGGIGALKVTNAVTCNNCLFYGNTNTGSGGTAIHGSSSTNDVTLNNCIIRDNGNATSSANGGAAIFVKGPSATSKLTMTNCLVYNNVNKSTGSVYGGGISSAGVTTITNCAIYNNEGNRGGGLALQVGDATYKSKLTMTGCTVSDNSLGLYNSSAFGGGIFIQGGSGLLTDNCSITNCTISGNSTPAISSPVTNSAGGGIQIGGSGSATWTPVITISNSTIYGNNVQGNPASSISGGGIDRLNGNAVINYSVVIGNNSNSSASGRNITNTASWLTSTAGRNMYEGSASWNSSVTTGNVILTESPTTILNTTLTDNGGTTALPAGSFVKTHALVAACAAINPSVAGSGLQTNDQRGIVRSTPDMGAYEYVTYRSKGSGNWGSISSWQSGDNLTWSDVTVVPTTNVAGSIAIQNGHEITVAANATSSALTINSGGKLTLNSGYSLGITGNLAINSDVDNGTGTVKDLNADGGLTVSNGTTNVQQYISSSAIGVTGRNWYISSPLTAATSSTITTATGNGLVFYDGTTNWPSAGTTMEVMKGYIAKSPAQNTTINFNGGTLNTGAQSVVNLPLGFNLVGNPYISSVDFSQATKTNVTNSIWYRSKKEGSYNFHTYNVTGGISINDGTAIIPPMQSFWIKTTSGTNTLGFTNAMRSHQDQSVVSNRLKAPKVSTQQLLRLQVSNSANSDETVIYFNSDAQNSLDDYDSQKMFNSINDVPEIFTKNGTSNLVINGMNSIPYDTEIPLGFATGETGSFSLSATEFKNFDAGTRIMLKDKNTPNTEVEISNGLAYNFSSQATIPTTDRFSLIFRAPETTTDIKANERMNTQVFVNAANQITIIAPEKSNYAIYNAVGQLIENGILNAKHETRNNKLTAGVYVV